MKRTNNIKRGGSSMSPELRADIEVDPEYWVCMLANYHTCRGRLTNEHALYYANKKVQRKFAIVKVCAAGHGVDMYQDSDLELPKRMRVWVALSRATEEEIYSISKVENYTRKLAVLNAEFGLYKPPITPDKPLAYQAPKPRSVRQKSTVSELEREARSFARVNGCSQEAAMVMLESLV